MAITLIHESLRLVNMRKDPWCDPKSPHRAGAHPHSSSCEHGYCSLWLVVNSVWGKSYSLVWSRCTHILLYGAGKGQGCLLSLEMRCGNFVPHLIFRDGGHQLRLHLYLDSFLFLILLPGSPFWEPLLTTYSQGVHCGLWVYGNLLRDAQSPDTMAMHVLACPYKGPHISTPSLW